MAGRLIQVTNVLRLFKLAMLAIAVCEADDSLDLKKIETRAFDLVVYGQMPNSEIERLAIGTPLSVLGGWRINDFPLPQSALEKLNLGT